MRAVEDRGRSNRQKLRNVALVKPTGTLLAPVPVTTTESTAAVTLSVKSRSVTVKVPLSLKTSIGFGQRRSIRSTSDHWCIARSGDRNGNRFGIAQRRAVIVRCANRVGQDERFAGGQEVKGFASGIEIPGECIGRLRAVEDRGRSDDRKLRRAAWLNFQARCPHQCR